MSRDGSALSAANLPWLEELHEAWEQDAHSVDGAWDEVFSEEESAETLKESVAGAPTAQMVSSDMVYKQSRVDSLIWAYRDVGYLYAHINPLAPAEGELKNYYTEPLHAFEQLTLGEFGLTEEDLEREFSAGRALSPSRMKLSEIIRALRETYCSVFAVEFLHIQNKPMRRWLIQQMESTHNRPVFPAEKKHLVLEDLIRAEEFEHFMHTAFIGQKRFSLEGAESVIPALHHVVDSAPGLGITDIELGMTHRGRLTVLNRILGKPMEDVFSEFEGQEDPDDYGGGGDVRYHLGYEMDHETPDGGRVRVNLVANPSHLESVGPVVQGVARGVQRERGDTERKKVVPIVLHGDAAFSGQGVVAETFNLATLKGYKTGGTLHVVINNQIGFTTSTRDARSSFFPTDVAKMLPIPVFHVNGDHPEAVVYAMDLALRFRQTFGRDVVVDIICYRKYGHNEGDDPSFTHPLMYRIIEKKKSVPLQYAERCRLGNLLTVEEEQRLRLEFRASLKEALQKARAPAAAPKGTESAPAPAAALKGTESAPAAGPAPANAWNAEERVPGPPEKQLRDIAERITTQPNGFHMHPKLKRIVDEKVARLRKDGTLDWAFAESLAFGSLLLDGIPLRLSGQDSARGTFSQRHLVWWDAESLLPLPYTPLGNLSPDKVQFSVYDSPLSEYSVLGFEYGFTLGRPRALVMWEAQFGDFANGAQVIVDNYVAAGEAKWGTVSGIVLLLPHGFEGQGPEHSSAHLEMFLQLCARDNIQVCNCSTPAQYFHLLRRQALRSFRKPLIVMTPKSLLRNPRAVSALADLSGGPFQEVLDDPLKPAKPRRLLLCSGKVYYDLAAAREEKGNAAAAIVRIEQLYPFPREQLAKIMKTYKSASEVIWVQEEPRNRGAWGFVKDRFEREFPVAALSYIGREESASPATGSHARHEREQQQIVVAALWGEPRAVTGK
ncbi:MAG: 2-oxoglutarate dehydrogenase E1 component [Spirochaetia bacterium]